MTLGNNTTRLTRAILSHMLAMGLLFYLTQPLVTFTKSFTGLVNIDELALSLVLVSMLAFLVGVAITGAGSFFKNPDFLKNVCATTITLNVIVGATNLVFTGAGIFLNSAVAYYSSFFGFGLIVLAAVSMFAFIYQAKELEPSVGETILAVIAVSVVGTLLFATMSIGALAVVFSFLLGFVIHSSSIRRQSQSASVTSLDRSKTA